MTHSLLRIPGLCLAALLCALQGFGQTLPSLHNLAATYAFTTWSSGSNGGTYPTSMRFHLTRDPTDGAYNGLAEGTADYLCDYNATSNTRIDGLNGQGLAFVGSSTGQGADCASNPTSVGRHVGAAVLGLNTTNQTSIQVGWTAQTVVNGQRVFKLQLQYRVGNSGNYTDLASSFSSSNVFDETTLTLTLPAACNDKPIVYLRWIYQSVSGSGTRPQIRLDEISVSATSLPVTYYSFKGKADNGRVNLSWATSSERNNAYFEVQRSKDALTFTSLGQVLSQGEGDTRREYSFSDETPLTGLNYYRLRQVDVGGSVTVSRPIAVINRPDGEIGQLSIGPNPVQDELRVDFSEADDAVGLRLSSLTGQVLRQGAFTDHLSLGDLPRGLYVLEVKTADGRVFRQRVLK